MSRIEEYLRRGSKLKASDIHLAPGAPVMYRIDGQMVIDEEEKLKPLEVEELLNPLLTQEQYEYLEETGELDFAKSIFGFSRVRFNVFRQRGTYAVAMRILSFEVPDWGDLFVPEAVVKFTHLQRGLILVTGATGTGKSTTLASLIKLISQTYEKNIITIEDPIEYLHPHASSMVLQREIGSDTKTYSNALRAALREDPDVILVGEMRDLETIATAITAAETGHLVFATLHTNNTSEAIDRMIDVFPPFQQQQIRIQLANVLEGIVAQQLLPKISGGRCAAFEVLLITSAVRNLIREAKTHQIPSVIQTNRKLGMQTMDDAIASLYTMGDISADTARNYCFDLEVMNRKLGI